MRQLERGVGSLVLRKLFPKSQRDLMHEGFFVHTMSGFPGLGIRIPKYISPNCAKASSQVPTSFTYGA